MKNHCLVALFGAVVLMIGCKTKDVKSDQIEGVWQMDESAHTVAGITTNIALNHNGTFIAAALPPGFLQLESIKPDQGVSGGGTWSLTRSDSDDEQRLRLTFSKVDGNIGKDLPYGAELFIERSGAEVRLFYFEGDPDENRRVVFHRESQRG